MRHSGSSSQRHEVRNRRCNPSESSVRVATTTPAARTNFGPCVCSGVVRTLRYHMTSGSLNSHWTHHLVKHREGASKKLKREDFAEAASCFQEAQEFAPHSWRSMQATYEQFSQRKCNTHTERIALCAQSTFCLHQRATPRQERKTPAFRKLAQLSRHRKRADRAKTLRRKNS